MPHYGNSKDDFAQSTWILLDGGFKTGKTVLAATFSDKCPDTLPALVATVLDDMYWCQFDKKGTESLGAMKLSVDRCDLSVDCGNFDELLKGIKGFHEQLAARVKEKKTKTLVVDTITALDTALNSHLRKQGFDLEKNPGSFYNALLSRHMDFVNPIRAMDINVIFIAHLKSKVAFMESKETESERTRRKAASIGGDVGKLGVDITGKAGEWYKGQVSSIWPLVATVEKGKPTTRMILPYGGQGYEGGCRYVGLDPAGEEAHLNKLFRKIRSLAA
jgi:hypothetical protein